MSNSTTLVQFAREASSKEYYGNLTYYCKEVVPSLTKMIAKLCKHIEEQDKTISGLKDLKK